MTEIKCMWCGRKMSYSVLGQNLTSSHFCDNNQCQCFQIVLPDFMWAEFIKTKQKLDIAMGALKNIQWFCYAPTMGECAGRMQHCADETLEQIHALDQKDSE